MPRRHNIALLIETSNSYGRGLLRGITHHMREHQSWSVFLPEQGRGDAAPPWLRDWQGDGIIARIENENIASAIRSLDIPFVDVSAARLVPECPWVETNNEAIADLAAQHLLERGFKNFAFCGDPQYAWSNQRQSYFVKRIEKSKYICHTFNTLESESTQAKTNWSRTQRQLENWVKDLPKPVGIMACFDIRGQRLLDACREMNIPVPEEVAVIGVDNDEILCELSNPPMTSIIPDTQRTGYEAASLLHRMMQNEKVSADPILIKPLGIAERLSTNVAAIDDPLIARAVQTIREEACLGINVQELVRRLPVSRRVFESKFKTLLGRTPHEEIARIRLERAKELLRETDLPLTIVAERSGFNHVEYLSTQFKKETGIPPSHYRKQHQSRH